MRKVALKYCGGCNPWFDRVALAERVIGEIGLTPAGGGEADLTLVVNGCSRSCASGAETHSVRDTFVISAPEDYRRVFNDLKSLI